MIASLRGRLAGKHPPRIIVDVQGVGYDVQVPLSTYAVLGAEGTEVFLHVHTHVREDQIALYGFGNAHEQQIFERLIAVSGVGPKVALAVLSGIRATDLVEAVQAGDPARLVTIPGIGRKTADRIVLELRDRLPAGSGDGGEAVPAASGIRADLLSALVNLGYHRPAVERAVSGLLKDAPDATFEDALRDALARLARA
jgi:holliday junction DNA helicase RuvA